MVPVKPGVVTVSCDAVKLVTVALPAVRLVVLTVKAPKLPIDPDAAVVQFPLRLFAAAVLVPAALVMPHCKTLMLVTANALGIGKVITNPELTNSVAKTLLILVWADRCVVVVILDIFLPFSLT